MAIIPHSHLNIIIRFYSCTVFNLYELVTITVLSDAVYYLYPALYAYISELCIMSLIREAVLCLECVCVCVGGGVRGGGVRGGA